MVRQPHTKQSLLIDLDLCHYIALDFSFISLSSLIDNLSEGLHSYKCADCKFFLDYMVFKDNQLMTRCFECKKNCQKDFNKELIERFANVYEFCNGDINKFIMLLRKGVYLYEYMDSWESFDETSLSDKEAFYSSRNMEDMADVDYRHAKRLLKYFNNKNLGNYHHLYVNTLLLAHVSENLRNKCIENIWNLILLSFYQHLD